jgi:hypothetical protein
LCSAGNKYNKNNFKTHNPKITNYELKWSELYNFHPEEYLLSNVV